MLLTKKYSSTDAYPLGQTSLRRSIAGMSYAQRMKGKSEAATGGTSRLEAYTDGVFAIAATLLVLDLSAAAFPAIHSDAELWSQLAAMSEKFTSFIISFILISMLWIFHVRQFRQINRSDTILLWINSARLMFIVLIPFSTGMSSEYSSYLAGKILLPINIVMAILLGFLTWLWAAKDHHLLAGDVTQAQIHAQRVGGVAAVLAGTASVIASVWIGAYAFFIYLLSGPAAQFYSTLTKRVSSHE